jgi:SpoVK/Ycf46/Vps4 family AAA+-type ATPase
MEAILKLLKDNALALLPVLLAGGGLFVSIKTIGKLITDFLVKHITTELVLTSANVSFYNAMEWIDRKGLASKFRKIKLFNGHWGYSNKTTKSVGYGKNVIFIDKKLVFVTLNKEDGSATSSDKESLYLSYFGRSHEFIDKIIKEFEPEKDPTKVMIKQFSGDSWRPVPSARKLDWDKVYFNTEEKVRIERVLTDFINNKEWYLKHNIPYRLGILLSGIPGSGKTTLIKGLASKLNYSLNCLPTDQMKEIGNAINTLDEKSIMYIEDVDSSGMVDTREVKEEDKDDPFKGLKFDSGGLSLVLNAIDGISDSDGRIVIFSTNKPEDIDPAVLRPGRIDLRLHIDYLDKDQFQLWLINSFDNPIDILTNKKYSNLDIKEVTIAELTNLFRMGNSQEDIVTSLLNEPNIRLLG